MRLATDDAAVDSFVQLPLADETIPEDICAYLQTYDLGADSRDPPHSWTKAGQDPTQLEQTTNNALENINKHLKQFLEATMGIQDFAPRLIELAKPRVLQANQSIRGTARPACPRIVPVPARQPR